jgi:hypothetical protein
MLTISTQTPKKIFNKENEFARALKKSKQKRIETCFIQDSILVNYLINLFKN